MNLHKNQNTACCPTGVQIKLPLKLEFIEHIPRVPWCFRTKSWIHFLYGHTSL
jgi:hypothetical protein